MEDWLEKIMLHWKKYFLKFGFGVAIFLIVVHILYKIRTGIYWLESEWSAGDVLSLAGALLSFLGTVILGCITTKVSIDNNRINSKLVEIEGKREALDKEQRLGYIYPEKMEIEYIQHTEEHLSSGSISYGTEYLPSFADSVDTMIFRIQLKISANSIINRLTRKSICVKEFGLGEDEIRGLAMFTYLPFYLNSEPLSRGINMKDNSFEDIFVLSSSSREPECLETMKTCFKKHIEYLICMEYEYINVLNEKRKITLQLTCRENAILKSEIISVE